VEQVILAKSWIAGDYHCRCKLLRRESSGGDKGISRISRDTRTDIHVLCYKGIVGRPLLAHSCTWNLGHQTIIMAAGGGGGTTTHAPLNFDNAVKVLGPRAL
jgi:hypothetical protein